MSPVDPAALDRFLASVERRALAMAEYALGQREDALDAVQEAMLTLVRRYATRPPDEWAPLFYRVLESRIADLRRRRGVRERWRAWFGGGREEQTSEDPWSQIPDPAAVDPALAVDDARFGGALDAALKALPLRQQQCFLLRAWEGLDVAATARAMGCSEGSVKTHYSRATAALRARLGPHWSGAE